MIVTDPQGLPLAEITRMHHPVRGTCLKMLQNPHKYLLIPLDSVAALSDSLIDALERIEAKCDSS